VDGQVKRWSSSYESWPLLSFSHQVSYMYTGRAYRYPPETACFTLYLVKKYTYRIFWTCCIISHFCLHKMLCIS
jgi:hypothetical protein